MKQILNFGLPVKAISLKDHTGIRAKDIGKCRLSLSFLDFHPLLLIFHDFLGRPVFFCPLRSPARAFGRVREHPPIYIYINAEAIQPQQKGNISMHLKF